mmetsp:Transcript_18533/g.36359  ORF Transcript_18533/g.36359 Transcript_18533/m.36359 type:complete len:227 (-) Transcript_18533:70-750(-)
MGESTSDYVDLRTRLLEDARKEWDDRLRGIGPQPTKDTPRLNDQHQLNGGDESQLNGGWSKADEEAQAEAIRTIQLLVARQTAASPEGHAASVQHNDFYDMRRQLDQERALRLAAQDQVRCLELELDNKESAIHALETNLDQRAQELRHTQIELQQMQQKAARELLAMQASKSSGYDQVRALREQVLELEYQMQLKDMQIGRLAGNFRRRPSLGDDMSTICCSERS